MVTQIDCKRSLQTGKLQINTVQEYLDNIVVIVMEAGLVAFCVWKFFTTGATGDLGAMYRYVLLPSLALLGIFVLYKKIVEKRLTRIETGYDKAKNRELIVNFMETEGYKVLKNSQDIIIGYEESDLTSSGWQFNVLLDDRSVYVSVLKLHPILRFPSFFNADSMVKDLRTYLNKF